MVRPLMSAGKRIDFFQHRLNSNMQLMVYSYLCLVPMIGAGNHPGLELPLSGTFIYARAVLDVGFWGFPGIIETSGYLITPELIDELGECLTTFSMSTSISSFLVDVGAGQ